ncbi:MAG TPA: ribonuclease, partial [Candidatus Syntrophosphaera thermopropionivorans]|nr:ribonuclease [Candidatus Syntrophosphaera thermopropionivorans]
MTEALIGTESNDWKNGLRSARMHGYGTSAITMQENKSNGLGTLSFFYRRYGSDAQVNWKAEYSIDNGNSWIQIGSAFTAPASDTPSFFSELVNVSGNVRIRILSATGSGSTNKRLNIDDITLTDYAPVEPTIIINPSLLSGFNYEAMNGPSSAQSYILTANNLNPLTGNITVSASGSFEVSDNNTLFYPTLVLPYSGGTISELTLYVRLKAGLNPGTYQNENIVHTGGGATALLGVSGSVFISIIPLTGDGYYESFTSFVSIASLPGGWSLGDEYVYEGDFGTGSTGGLRGNGVLGIQLSGTYPNNMLTATLTLQNQTGVTLNNLDVSYTGKVARNDQPGTPKWVVSVNGTEIPELEYSTAEGINLTKNATLTGFNIAEGEYVVIQWFTTIVGTNGTRRQIGLDDVIVSTNINNNPFISVTAGLVPFLTGQGIPSEAQSYLLGGLELSQNINLTACTGFEISVDGGVNYSASTNVLPAFEGQVFIRMTGISSGFFTGYITHTSLGAEQFSLPVSGIVSNTSPEPVELPYLQASRLIAYPANTDITLEWIP